MFCTKCGGQLAPDGSCPRCSQAAQQPQVQQYQTPPQVQQYQQTPPQGYAPAPAPKPAANFDFQALIQDKNKVMMILAGVAAVLLLFLPVISVSIMGVAKIDCSLFSCFSAPSFMGQPIPGLSAPIITGLLTLVAIAGAGATVYGIYKNNKQMSFYGAIGAAAAMVISAITTILYVEGINSAMKAEAGEFGSMIPSISGFGSLGIGFWIGIILLGINAYIAYTESKK